MKRHSHHSPDRFSVPTAVLTVSDTRTRRSDSSGDLIARLLSEGGHTVVRRAILPDEPGRIRGCLKKWSRDPGVAAIILTGGTGIAPRDRTFEAVDGLLEKKLEGFGELFRMLSYRQVGSAAILSRATAGTFRGRIVFSLPGSEAAVELALSRLILPELGHLFRELSRPSSRAKAGKFPSTGSRKP